MTQYLIGVGAAKCGTTLLYDLLEPHPALSKAKVKELHYFDKTDAPSKQEYDALFDGPGVKLDVTPIYMFYEDCIEKMARVLGAENIKVVVLLRDPIERARSHYYMAKEQGTEPLSFRESFVKEAQRTAQGDLEMRLHSHFMRGLYAKQLRNIYRFLPRENVRVYIFERFVKGQQAVIDDVCDFAGIEPIAVRDKHSNPGVASVRSEWLGGLVRVLSRKAPRALRLRFLRRMKHMIVRVNEKKDGKQPLDPEFMKELIAYYQADVDALSEEFGLDTSSWRNFSAPPTRA